MVTITWKVADEVLSKLSDLTMIDTIRKFQIILKRIEVSFSYFFLNLVTTTLLLGNYNWKSRDPNFIAFSEFLKLVWT